LVEIIRRATKEGVN